MWNTYVALDLETTGLSPMRDQILEIGAARVENGEITGTYETFVDSGVEIPDHRPDGNHSRDDGRKPAAAGSGGGISGIFRRCRAARTQSSV
mgnify:CR=1 FL=1